jgi:hypothetical protein
MTSKKIWVTKINLSPGSWDSDNLIKKKTENNNKVHFLKWTTSKDVIGKENDINPY